MRVDRHQNPSDSGPKLLIMLPLLLAALYIVGKQQDNKNNPTNAPANVVEPTAGLGTALAAAFSTPTAATEGNNQSASSTATGATAGDLTTMWLANKNIVVQMIQWKQAREANGESPTDWAAFRQHERNMGNADPGPNPPPQFYYSSYSTFA